MSKDKRDLIIIRHAQAEPVSNSGLDFDRPLTSRGEEHAILIARRAMSYELKIDHIDMQSSLRTKMTALLFVERLAFRKTKFSI